MRNVNAGCGMRIFNAGCGPRMRDAECRMRMRMRMRMRNVGCGMSDADAGFPNRIQAPDRGSVFRIQIPHFALKIRISAFRIDIPHSHSASGWSDLTWKGPTLHCRLFELLQRLVHRLLEFSVETLLLVVRRVLHPHVRRDPVVLEVDTVVVRLGRIVRDDQ